MHNFGWADSSQTCRPPRARKRASIVKTEDGFRATCGEHSATGATRADALRALTKLLGDA